MTPQTDPLAERPALASPPSFHALAPEVFRTAQGLTVWLIARPALPLVALTLSLPVGSADDPTGKAGLASITANMLDEGAGDRGAIELSTAIEDLGAQLSTHAGLDGSTVGLSVLKKHLDAAFDVFADVVARPRFDQDEWDRVTKLWKNQIERRADDPSVVARLVARAVAYGPDTPYGHPSGGLSDTAAAITLDDAKGFYRTHFRPDRAVLVAAGAITRAELEALIESHLSDWKKPAASLPDRSAPPSVLASRPKLVLVDRPGAPQSWIYLALPGVAAADADSAPLELVNTALGGSFTSRLNLNLREDKAWTYGAGSSFVESRGQGPFFARAAVHANVTAAAVKEMLREIGKMAEAGIDADEHAKARAHDIAQLIAQNESIGSLAHRLGTLAILGLPPDHDARASAARQRAGRAELVALAKRHLDTSKASVVVVGPKAQIAVQLRTLDLGEPEEWTTEGSPL